jgi:hypothetical protein
LNRRKNGYGRDSTPGAVSRRGLVPCHKKNLIRKS